MTAIKAVFANHRRVPTRGAFQIILEVEEDQQKQVFDALGYPNSGTTIWVAVARIEINDDKPPFIRNMEEV